MGMVFTEFSEYTYSVLYVSVILMIDASNGHIVNDWMIEQEPYSI